MKSHHRKPEIEDAELLRASLSDVVPLASANRAQLAKPRPRPVAAQRLRDERAALEDSLNGMKRGTADSKLVKNSPSCARACPHSR
jgi:hypothetical protein